MVEVSSTGRKILYDNDINFTNPTPVIQLYPRAYGQTDSFTPSDGQKKKPSFLGRLARDLLGVGAIWFAGKKGLFGKGIKNWLNHVISNKKFNKIMQSRMTEYLQNCGKGVQSTELITNAAGKKVLKATFADGSTKEYLMRTIKGKVILSGSAEQKAVFSKIFKRSNKQSMEERIIFNRKDGAVEARTVMRNKKNSPFEITLGNGTKKTINGTKTKTAATYRGENVLDKDFNEVTNIYKHYVHKGPFRRFIIGGPKVERSVAKNYPEHVTTATKIVSNENGIPIKSKTVKYNKFTDLIKNLFKKKQVAQN